MRVWDLVRKNGTRLAMRGPVPATGDVIQEGGSLYLVEEVRHVYRVSDDGAPECVGVECRVGLGVHAIDGR